MKKIIFISFLMIGMNSFCQTKKPKKTTQSKKTETVKKQKNKNLLNSTAKYWYLIDKQTNKIVDTIMIYDFVFDEIKK